MNTNVGTVLIQFVGPKSLIPGDYLARSMECNLNMTWNQFLTTKYQLKKQLNDDMIVTTASYKTTKRQQANLGDKVKDFICKFPRVRKVFKLRLRTKESPVVSRGKRSTAKQSTSAAAAAAGVGRERLRSRVGHGRKVVGVTHKSSEQHYESLNIPFTNLKHGSSSSYLDPMDDQYFEPLNEEMNFEDDRFSVLSDVVRKDLWQEGIKNTIIKPSVVSRLDNNFDNAEMLRIQNELQKLVDQGNWQRLTSKVPRTGHVLCNIFQLRL